MRVVLVVRACVRVCVLGACGIAVQSAEASTTTTTTTAAPTHRARNSNGDERMRSNSGGGDPSSRGSSSSSRGSSASTSTRSTSTSANINTSTSRGGSSSTGRGRGNSRGRGGRGRGGRGRGTGISEGTAADGAPFGTSDGAPRVVVAALVHETADGAPTPTAALATPVRRASSRTAAATGDSTTHVTDNRAADAARRVQLRRELQRELNNADSQYFAVNGHLPAVVFVQGAGPALRRNLAACGIERTETIGPRCHVVVTTASAEGSRARKIARSLGVCMWSVKKLELYVKYEQSRAFRAPRSELERHRQRQIRESRLRNGTTAARRRPRRRRAPAPPKCGVVVERLFADAVFTIPQEHGDAVPAPLNMLQRVSHETKVAEVAALLHATFVEVSPQWTEVSFEVVLWASHAQRQQWRRAPEVLGSTYNAVACGGSVRIVDDAC